MSFFENVMTFVITFTTLSPPFSKWTPFLRGVLGCVAPLVLVMHAM